MTGRGRGRVETGSKRVRVMLGGHWVADTRSPLLVWEKPHYPTYYFPMSDVDQEVLRPTREVRPSRGRGQAVIYDVEVPGASAPGAAYRHPESPIEAIRQAVAFRWDAMDHWFEEAEEVFVHARDPYKRVDLLGSDRGVRIEIDGVVVAETTAPVMLFETGLPARIYIRMTDVRLDLLEPSDTETRCPYKGTARYWSVGAHRDIVWSYRIPTQEASKVAGLLAFYDEKVDVYLDDVLQEKPTTVFS